MIAPHYAFLTKFGSPFPGLNAEGRVENRAIFVALGVNLEGHKEVLGLWTSVSEAAKFWLQILTELRNRAVQDILVACVDGMRGFPDAIATVYPKTQALLCIVHLMRNSLTFVSWKERKTVALDLKQIYHAATTEEAEGKLAEFEARWDARYSSIGKLWRRHWAGVVGLFSFPQEIRRAIYTNHWGRVAEHDTPQGDQDARFLFQRRFGLEVDLPGSEKRLSEIALRPELAHFSELLHAAMWRSNRSCSAAPQPIRWNELASNKSTDC